MSVNSAICPSNDYTNCVNKLSKLKEMLEMNISAQKKLISNVFYLI